DVLTDGPPLDKASPRSQQPHNAVGYRDVPEWRRGIDVGPSEPVVIASLCPDAIRDSHIRFGGEPARSFGSASKTAANEVVADRADALRRRTGADRGPRLRPVEGVGFGGRESG